MKKISTIILSLFMIISLAGCNSKEETANDVETPELIATRSVVVSNVSGSVTITHVNNETVEAYEGMTLYHGDDVVVGNESSLVLNIDSDKHVFADANCHFWLTALGVEDDSQTVINLDTGSVLCEIDEKLAATETFDIKTASSTMSVRGTVFRVNLIKGQTDLSLVEVYDGFVNTTTASNEEVLIEAGQCTLVKEDATAGTSSFVTEFTDDIVETLSSASVVLNISEDGEPVLAIDYNNLPKTLVENLIEISSTRKELAISTEELQEIKTEIETKEAEAEQAKDEVKQETRTFVEPQPQAETPVETPKERSSNNESSNRQSYTITEEVTETEGETETVGEKENTEETETTGGTEEGTETKEEKKETSMNFGCSKSKRVYKC